eukprot:642976-Pelagomonas_calceolata.AAC.1
MPPRNNLETGRCGHSFTQHPEAKTSQSTYTHRLPRHADITCHIPKDTAPLLCKTPATTEGTPPQVKGHAHECTGLARGPCTHQSCTGAQSSMTMLLHDLRKPVLHGCSEMIAVAVANLNMPAAEHEVHVPHGGWVSSQEMQRQARQSK